MTEILSLAALWLGLALLATLLSIWLRIATALSEIVVGTVAQLVIGAAVGGLLLRYRPGIDLFAILAPRLAAAASVDAPGAGATPA